MPGIIPTLSERRGAKNSGNPLTLPNTTCPKGPAIEWVRKRDGEVSRFEPDKLTRSLQLATAALDDAMLPDAVAELARMAMFFLRAQFPREVVETSNIADWVEKSLLQTGHEELARSYSSYRDRKLWARRSLVVCREASLRDAGLPEPTHWDKLHIVQSLRASLSLDAARARQIAGEVERKVLNARFTSLTTDLVRELVNNELATLGHAQRLTASGCIHVRTSDLKRQLTQPPGLGPGSHFVAGKIWRDFALNEIVSRDVAEAERRGLLRTHGLESQPGLVATALNCAALVRQSHGSRDSIARFGRRLADAAESTPLLIALDLVEYWLALVAEPNDSPSQAAELFWQELSLRLRSCSTQCVLNLYGGVPRGVIPDVGAGPLFEQQPAATEEAFAEAVAEEILGRLQRDAPDWRTLRVDWHWHLGSQRARTTVARAAAEGLPVAIVFDRQLIPLGEGLRRLTDNARKVLEYVGISLPTVWREAGSPRSLVALEDGLVQAVQLAVRGAVQKREFLRRLPRILDSSLIDHAVLAVAPIGLDWTVRQLTGKSFTEEEGSLRLAETLLRSIRETAERESKFFSLGIIVDGWTGRQTPNTSASGAGDDNELLEGSSPTASGLGVRRQIHAAGRLHGVAQAGTLIFPRDTTSQLAVEGLEETLNWAAQSTELVRLRFGAIRPVASQIEVNWPEGDLNQSD